MKLVGANHPMLHTPARWLVTEQDYAGLLKLLGEMVAFTNQHKALGLAAPQVGVPLRVALVRRRSGELVALVNPTVLMVSERTKPKVEACLSLPNLYRAVCRPALVRVSTEGVNTRERRELLFCDDEARAALHELDHLAGILITDPRHANLLELGGHAP